MTLRPGRLRELVEHDPEVNRQLLEAEIIIAVDTSGEEETFLGRRLLEEIVRTNKPASHSLIKVGVDGETDDVEFLRKFCETFRGGCDYEKGK